MGNIQTFDEGARILQNVDVSSIVTSLAIGIADAQERLDNNSVSQLIRLSTTQVGGKSLLELGFQPAFYAFDYADISASISLKMALKEDVSVDFSLSVDYKNNTTFDKSFFNQLSKSRTKSLSRYSKTEKEVSLKAKTSKEVSINETTFEIHKEEGSYSKVESAKEQMRDESSDLRVDSVIEDDMTFELKSASTLYATKEGGYVIIAKPYVQTNTEGLLKMLSNSYATTEQITLKTTSPQKKFDKKTDFDTTLAAAVTTNGGTVIGIKSDGIYRTSGVKRVFEFLYDWNKYDINYSYSTGVKSDALQQEDVKLLAMLLRRDPALKITVTGYTDGSGSDTKLNADYNQALGDKRAKAFKNEILKRGEGNISESQIQTASKGEDLANGSSAKDPLIRKISVELPADYDYIHFDGGSIVKAEIATAGDSVFVYCEEMGTAGSGLEAVFQYGDKTYTLTELNLDLALSTAQNYKIEEFYAEKVNDYYYLLHEEAMVNYFVHAQDSREIDVEVEQVASADLDKDTTKIFVSDTKNDLSRLKQSSKDFEGDRSLAISGSLDVRYARQFNMSVEGNASVSARMISVPPPTAMENYIQSLTSGGTSTSAN